MDKPKICPCADKAMFLKLPTHTWLRPFVCTRQWWWWECFYLEHCSSETPNLLSVPHSFLFPAYQSHRGRRAGHRGAATNPRSGHQGQGWWWWSSLWQFGWLKMKLRCNEPPWECDSASIPGAVPGARYLLLRRHVSVAPAQAAWRCHPSEAFHQGAAPSITDCRVPQHIYRRQQYVYSLLIKSSGSSHRVLYYFIKQMKWRRCTFLPVCVCLHRAPHKEAAAAGSQPAGPFVTPSQSGHTEGRCTLSLERRRHSKTVEFPLQELETV